MIKFGQGSLRSFGKDPTNIPAYAICLALAAEHSGYLVQYVSRRHIIAIVDGRDACVTLVQPSWTMARIAARYL